MPETPVRPPVDLSQLPPQAYNLAPVAYRVSGPGTLAALPAFPADAPKNRLGLAQWLTSPEHPLLDELIACAPQAG